jgi:hypothetical protein
MVSWANTFTEGNYSCCDPSAVKHWAFCSKTEKSWLDFLLEQKRFLSSMTSGLALESAQPSSVEPETIPESHLHPVVKLKTCGSIPPLPHLTL